jgi:hypothetical protein
MIDRLARIAPALLALAVVAAPMAAAPAAAATDRAAAGEAELAQMLEGRVAGEPVECIQDHSSDSLQIVDGTALVFRRGATIYVNRPEGARTIDYWDLPVIHRFGGSKLCRLDRVELRDRTSHFPGPSLFLAQFVPYTRPAS